MQRILGSLLVASLFACAPAYADRPGPIAATGLRSPYDVQILDEDGAPLRTYGHRGRYYVLGDHGERYQVHVSNPTARRIEAVITVDGLDVIDGENGDGAKRGYVIQPYGDLRVEGFRTSTTDVATFRFSSVGASYAGRKGKARNVGVIAVAIFEEKAQRPVYIPAPQPPIYYDNTFDDNDVTPGISRSESSGGSGKSAPAPRPASPAGEAGSAAPPSAAPTRSAAKDASGYQEAESAGACCAAPRRERAGLGTEYGEQRYSAVSFTRFVRASSRPAAVAELRYNDADGLMALGIRLAPEPYGPDEDELYTRETANPFPGDRRFSRPPAGVY